MDAQFSPPHLAPMLAAVQYGALAVASVLPGHDSILRIAGAEGCPLLLIIGDDLPDVPATGPDGFDREVLTAALAGCQAVLVYSAGAEARVYAMAVVMAEVFGRAVMIETKSYREFEWLKVLKTLAPDAAPLVISADLGKYRNGGRA